MLNVSSSWSGNLHPQTQNPCINTQRGQGSVVCKHIYSLESERAAALTDRDLERFLWCFLDFFECFLVLE